MVYEYAYWPNHYTKILRMPGISYNIMFDEIPHLIYAWIKLRIDSLLIFSKNKKFR